jgi:hypothetical protein
MDEGQRLRHIGAIRARLGFCESELGQIASLGDEDAAHRLRVLASSLLEQAASAMDLAMRHERAIAVTASKWLDDDRDTETNLERPEP